MTPDTVEQFIVRWKSSGAAERANHQLFITELCDVLDVPRPEPATPDDDRNAYVFERAVRFTDGTGHTTVRFMDLYKRGCFVLEKARTGRKLSDAERTVYEHGLVAVLAELHDELDRAVFTAYGWDDLAERLVGRPGALTPVPDKPAEIADAERELLARLLALNAERAAEEERGVVRWLRPEFQAPDQAATQPDLDISVPAAADSAKSRGSKRRRAWPKRVSDQVQALLTEIEALSAPTTAADLARRFLRAPTDTVRDLLDTLAALGRLHRLPDGRYEPG
ncbi:MAG: hypothetical protein GXP31_18980 [Kiritimatiellaeota bacterium]|nr:hypothetical protein [Kiritimatiellota bacterium]